MKTTNLLKFLGISLLLAACQESNDILQEMATDVKADTAITDTEQNHKVTPEIATKVAELYAFKGINTRSVTPQVSDIQTIKDDNSEVLMYVVNFANNSGYVLVSATKKYYPILAYAEQGRFDANLKGVDIWLEDEKNMMKMCLSDTTATYNLEWLQYEQRDKTSNSKIATRAESNWPETLDWWWSEVGQELTSSDYQSDFENSHTRPGLLTGNYCCHVDEARSMLPGCESIYSEMAAMCQSYGFSEEDVIYHIREFYTETRINPLLETNWTQGYPYNWKVEKPLGCVTVAVAQIMYHHRKPAYYQWDEINVDEKTEIQGNFFKELGEQLGIDYDTNEASANLGDAKRVLQRYGYSTSEKDNCSTEEMYSALKANQPVCITGFTHQILDFNAGSGHAWVCDGYKFNKTFVVLTVYTPFGSYPDSKGLYATNPYSPQFNQTGETTYSSCYYHMNWGWGESYNTMWNRAGDYTAPNGKVYKRNTQYLFVKP